MKRSILTLVAVFVLGATACTSAESDDLFDDVFVPTGGEGIFAQGAGVTQFDSCREFLDHVRSHAVDLVGPYGFEGYGGGWYGGDVAFSAAEDGGVDRLESSTPTTAAAGGAAGVDYSTTNVQVAGVDEPDIVKTDGDRLFVVAQQRIYWVDVTGEPSIVASLPLDGWGHQLFLSGDTLLVMTSGNEGGIPFSRGIAEDAIAYYSPRTVLREIDISDPDSMDVTRTITMDGTLLSSRLLDGTARIVVRSEPTGFAWNYPDGSGLKAEREATNANKRLVETSTLENWVPWYVLEDHTTGTTSDGPLLGCDQVGHPDDFSGLSMLNVLTIDLEDGVEPGNGIGLLAEGQTVYASSEYLYVATGAWMVWPLIAREGQPPENLSTEIHMFDISDPETARYVASGDVDGVLMSQWSMDEFDGTLRVVVTDESPFFGSETPPSTSVVTMQRVGDRLEQVGSVGGLGKNERVYAVRMIGDRGYVVTFRQVDPLYVVDLSDPYDPSVEGELKINGYSAYLHPIGEHLLLGVGQDATDEGRTLGTQMSVFDVSDPANPQRMARLTFDEAYSEAEWDHHAFLWWAPEEIAVLPLQRWSWDERTGVEDSFSGAAVVSATPERLKELTEISHPKFGDDECEECGSWSAPIMRSLIVGDTLYTVSETGLLASDLETFESDMWVSFSQ